MLSARHVAARAPSTPAPRAARGWTDPRALELAKEAIEAKKAGDYPLCIQKDQASLLVEEHPYVRLHLSACLLGNGQPTKALESATTALRAGIQAEDDELMRVARRRIEETRPRLAKLRIVMPERTSAGLKVTLNGVRIRPEEREGRISVDPGEYTVEAIREEKGERWFFRERVTAVAGAEKDVEVIPRRDHLRPDEEQCLRAAQTREEKLRCLEEAKTTPNVHLGIETSGYTDSTHVHVLTPAVRAAIDSPTGGWSAAGSYLLDVVTAASPDLVSTASRPFVERRHAGSLSGGYKLPFAQVGAHANVSSEPDYLSRTVGGSIATELADKMITPRVGYAYSWDTIGYRDSPFRQFRRPLDTHAIEAGVTVVLSPYTLLVVGLSASFERGENAKLYRFVPMFAPSVAPRIQPGASAADIDAARLSVRAREEVPDRRDRVALGARLNQRIGASSTLRVEERGYTDDWGILASTTDLRYLHDLGDRLRVWPHLRVHAQSGASFYALAYTARLDPSGGPLDLPRYRTTDREASPMLALTGGGGARIVLSGEKTKPEYAIVVSGDVMWNRYFESLFILSRTAVWGTIGFEVEL